MNSNFNDEANRTVLLKHFTDFQSAQETKIQDGVDRLKGDISNVKTAQDTFKLDVQNLDEILARIKQYQSLLTQANFGSSAAQRLQQVATTFNADLQLSGTQFTAASQSMIGTHNAIVDYNGNLARLIKIVDDEMGPAPELDAVQDEGQKSLNLAEEAALLSLKVTSVAEALINMGSTMQAETDSAQSSAAALVSSYQTSLSTSITELGNASTKLQDAQTILATDFKNLEDTTTTLQADRASEAVAAGYVALLDQPVEPGPDQEDAPAPSPSPAGPTGGAPSNPPTA